MRSFFVLSEREKETTTHKERRQAEDKRTSKECRKRDKRRTKKKKSRGQKDKIRGKHATSHKTAKHLTHTKTPQSTQRPQPIQIYIRTPKPSKNPLKIANKGILSPNTSGARQ